ncbi:MAG: outer membrane lipoprotein carrier protein LolA [Muribaculaceae bacterium]|nr:outer membrane lipoprotein carrier protein LolA [Muribaculaceae bacterium]
MSRCTAILLALVLCAASLTARTSGGDRAAVPADVAAAIERVNGVAGGIRTMTCRFSQTKHLAMLRDEMQSSGTMAFVSPSRLRWEYTEPYSYRFIFNGDRVYVGNDAGSNVIDTRTNRMFGEIARLIINTVTGHIIDSADDFTFELTPGDKTSTFTLTPRKRELRQLISSIDLTFDNSGYNIQSVTLREKNGDHTDILLHDIQLNKPVNENLFAID